MSKATDTGSDDHANRPAHAEASNNGSELEDIARSQLESLALKDISPEDLFPPVSFSINDRADEDMPYTDPAKDSQTAPEKHSESKSHSKNRRLISRQDSDSSAKSYHSSGSGDFSTEGTGKAAATKHVDQGKETAAEDMDLGDDLPLVLSTLEDASVNQALSLDSNLSKVVEAVANGDIKPLTEKKRGMEPKHGSNSQEHSSVGRGPVNEGSVSDPPSKVCPYPILSCPIPPFRTVFKSA